MEEQSHNSITHPSQHLDKLMEFMKMTLAEDLRLYESELAQIPNKPTQNKELEHPSMSIDLKEMDEIGDVLELVEVRKRSAQDMLNKFRELSWFCKEWIGTINKANWGRSQYRYFN